VFSCLCFLIQKNGGIFLADDLINRILEEIGLESIAPGETDEDRNEGKYNKPGAGSEK